ncbi:hypothetical protein DPMN_154951 [Dreissena polymorpha]|uniref:Uncharacterized protein n=1 Tax=Dreissena polymorpha TaxID=45954 RepID=A0A9D4JAF9_DREPO|nr:hypothetical protein DPMN_154951 [Dreissena polymorpha]
MLKQSIGSYQAVTPKNVTFSRNCVGRIHGQVQQLNQGYCGLSTGKQVSLRKLTPESKGNRADRL